MTILRRNPLFILLLQQISFSMTTSDKIKNNKKKVIAHDYFRQGISQIEICSKVDISPQTLCRWVKEGGWKDERKSITQTRQELLRQYHTQLAELNDTILSREEGKRIPSKAEADIITQLTNTIKKIENEADISGIISVMVDFLEFVRKQQPDKALELSAFSDAFIKSKL